MTVIWTCARLFCLQLKPNININITKKSFSKTWAKSQKVPVPLLSHCSDKRLLSPSFNLETAILPLVQECVAGMALGFGENKDEQQGSFSSPQGSRGNSVNWKWIFLPCFASQTLHKKTQVCSSFSFLRLSKWFYKLKLWILSIFHT